MGMAYVVIFFLIIIMVALLGLISLALVIYKTSYRRYLDKRIAEHSLGQKQKKQFSPARLLFMLLLGAFFLIAMAVSGLEIWVGLRLNSDNKVLDGLRPEYEKIETILDGRTADDELPGYHRYTRTLGQDTLICYLAAEPNAMQPQLMFYLDTDLPRYHYQFDIQIDDSKRYSGGGDVKIDPENPNDPTDWLAYSFPFNFSKEKKYHSEVHMRINGVEMFVIPMNDIAAGELRNIVK